MKTCSTSWNSCFRSYAFSSETCATIAIALDQIETALRSPTRIVKGFSLSVDCVPSAPPVR
jgi:hypothetical protein